MKNQKEGSGTVQSVNFPPTLSDILYRMAITMDIQFIRERISTLRIKKNVSEYRMSTDLGHSKSYMQSISSGRSVPSLGEFLYICEYLGVTPAEFFDEDIEEPQLVQRLYELTRNMSEADLNVLISTAERLNDK